MHLYFSNRSQMTSCSFTCSYSVLPEWYVHNEPVEDNGKEVAMETNRNELLIEQEAKKKPMLGYDTMTVWQRLDYNLYKGLETDASDR